MSFNQIEMLPSLCSPLLFRSVEKIQNPTVSLYNTTLSEVYNNIISGLFRRGFL